MSQFLIQQPPNTISFHSRNSDWVMRITADRRIEVAEGVDVTEAARLVLDAMQGMLDVGLKRAVLEEREACAKVADLVAREIDDTNGTSTYIAAAIRARGEQT